MELRWALAVVTGGGAGLGRELAVGLSRVGAGVLVADLDLDAAEETAALVRAARVQAWALKVDVRDDLERRMLAHRARDLGGADVLVTTAGGWTAGDRHPEAPLEARSTPLDLVALGRLTELFLADVEVRRGRRTGTPAVVNVVAGAAAHDPPEHAAAVAGLVRLTTAMADPDTATRARVMAVVAPPVPPARVVRVVVDLVARGEAGQVVDLR